MPVCQTLQGSCFVISLSSLGPCPWRKPNGWFFRGVSLGLCLSLSWSLSLSPNNGAERRPSPKASPSSHTSPNQVSTVYGRSSGSQVSF